MNDRKCKGAIGKLTQDSHNEEAEAVDPIALNREEWLRNVAQCILGWGWIKVVVKVNTNIKLINININLMYAI